MRTLSYRHLFVSALFAPVLLLATTFLFTSNVSYTHADSQCYNNATLSVNSSLSADQNTLTVTVSGELANDEWIDEPQHCPPLVCSSQIEEFASSGSVKRINGSSAGPLPNTPDTISTSINQGSVSTYCSNQNSNGSPSTYSSGSGKQYNVSALGNNTYSWQYEVTDNRGGSRIKFSGFEITNRGGGSTYNLTVNSSGASSVPISGAPYGGTTNYTKTGIDESTEVSILAPATSGGKDFSSWGGCSSTSGAGGRVCNRIMDQNRTVTVVYDAPPPPPTCTFTTQLYVEDSTPPNQTSETVDVDQTVHYDIDVVNSSGCGTSWRKEIDFKGDGFGDPEDFDSTGSANGATTDTTFDTADVYTSKGRITALNPSPDVTVNTNNVTVTVNEPATVVCHQDDTNVDEDVQTNFWATGGSGTFAWSTDPAGADPDNAGNVSNFNNVSFSYPPGAYTVTVDRGATSDSCSITVNDVCGVGGDISIVSVDDATGSPLATDWTLSAPTVGYTHSETNNSSWSDTGLPVVDGSTPYLLTSDSNPAGYSNPTIVPGPWTPLTCGGDINFEIRYPVDTTPFIDVTPDRGSADVGETEQFSACYDSDGGGSGSGCDDITGSAVWAVGVAVGGFDTPDAATSLGAGLFSGDVDNGDTPAVVRADYMGIFDTANFQVNAVGIPQCSDGEDNDKDGTIDCNLGNEDRGCYPNWNPGGEACDPNDDDERDTTSGSPQCSNGIDDDGDEKIDFPADPGCDDSLDEDESDEPQCSDGLDNDGDLAIDFGDDDGCESPTDNDEREKPTIEEF